MTIRRTLGFIIGFIGILVLIGPSALLRSGAAMETYGQIMCFVAASCYALSSIFMRRLPPIDPVGLSAVTLIFGMAIVIPLAIFQHGSPPIPPAKGLLLVALLGLIPTATANLLRVLVVRSAGPVFMSLTSYQVPLWSVAFGVLILGEPMKPSLLWATLMILGGVGLSQYGAFQRLFRQVRSR